ncbi:hypothetical protein Taro_030721 [Colocasia esculenta]|uniref:Uncharacterized protein n=1 Tax=Colocasia esculenta TaxID=4460 RepID=A0A843VUS7_COLES|nr:hypothetical protein [Colocasia esculenta]
MASMKATKPQTSASTPKPSLASSKPQQPKSTTGRGAKPAAAALAATNKPASKPQAGTGADAKPAAGGCCSAAPK